MYSSDSSRTIQIKSILSGNLNLSFFTFYSWLKSKCCLAKSGWILSSEVFRRKWLLKKCEERNCGISLFFDNIFMLFKNLRIMFQNVNVWLLNRKPKFKKFKLMKLITSFPETKMAQGDQFLSLSSAMVSQKQTDNVTTGFSPGWTFSFFPSAFPSLFGTILTFFGFFDRFQKAYGFLSDFRSSFLCLLMYVWYRAPTHINQLTFSTNRLEIFGID